MGLLQKTLISKGTLNAFRPPFKDVRLICVHFNNTALNYEYYLTSKKCVLNIMQL